jgi:hypothetical protein
MKNWKEGLIVKIELPNGGSIFGKLLKFPLIQYYRNYNYLDKKLEGKMFEVWTMKNAIKKMEAIEQTELLEEDKLERKFFKYDMLKKKISIYCNEVEVPASKEEIKELECAAVWGLIHIEERYNAESNGKESIFKKSMEIIKYS